MFGYSFKMQREKTFGIRKDEYRNYAIFGSKLNR